MFKKSLVAMALVGAVGFAQAADVQVYGVMDAGFDYARLSNSFSNDSNTKELKFDGSKKTSSTKLATGKHSGNRFGIKGTEEIAPNLKAGFVLEGGFDLLNGDFADKGKLFNRQADLFVEGEFGHLAFGRVGTLTSANGTYGLFQNIADNFGGGWGDYVGVAKNAFVSSGRLDNAVTYVTPEIAGAKLHAQYSFNVKGEQKDKVKENTRYLAIGATYNIENLALVAVFDKTFHDNADLALKQKGTGKPFETTMSDRWTINLGGSYDLGVTKLFAAYQHGHHASDFGLFNAENAGKAVTSETFRNAIEKTMLGNMASEFTEDRLVKTIDYANGFKTNTLLVGADTPLLNGVLKTQVGYGEAKTTYHGNNIHGAKTKIKSWSFAAGYEYNLSKRTQLYTGVGYSMNKFTSKCDEFKLSDDVKMSFSAENKTRAAEVMMGLVHKF